MASVPSIQPFNSSTDDWTSWSRRFDQWLTISPYATGEDANSKKRAAFLIFIDSNSFKLLCSLCAPTKPEECSYTTLKEKLNKQYGVKKLVLAERHRFYNYKQQEGQKLSDYLAELRKLVATCDWSEDQLSENLQDKFLMGINNERLLQQLLTQYHRKALDDLVEIARTFEVAEKESLRRAEDSSTSNPSTVSVAATNSKATKKTVPSQPTRGNSKRQNSQSGRTGQCASCGGNHWRSTCRFRNAKCHKCNKQGHIQRVCQSSAVIVSTHSSHSLESAVVTVSPAEQVNDIPPVFQIVNLPDFSKKLRLVVDSASPITFINSKTWLDLNKPKLQTTTRVLGAFEGQPIRPVGYFKAKVSQEDASQRVVILQIYVSQNGINIIGRDGITKLNITLTPDMFGRVATVESTLPTALRDLLNIYDEIFKPELGHCVTTTANLCLREGVQPKFCKPRKLPFAIKPVVGDELDRLESQGAIEKVSHSDWATPIVIVRKPGGKVRICGNFKVTINPGMKTDIYPMPNPQELFQALNGGCKFTKLDLVDAYLQIELNEESKKMVVINTQKGLYRYRRLPFGLNSAPAIFQQIIDQTVAGIPGVVSYLDDLVVTGKTDQEHVTNLKKALETLKTAGFRLKMEKCQFFQTEVRYLGHIIDKNGIQPQPDKLKAIVDMPLPQNPKELRSFLIIMTSLLQDWPLSVLYSMISCTRM